MKKLFGFTLAEVLITLGIIGVVAVITIVTLNVNTNSTKYKSQFKKNLSLLNQSVKLNTANYGFDFSEVENCKDENKDSAASVNSICGILNSSLEGKRAYKYNVLKTKDNQLYYSVIQRKGATPDTLIKDQGVQLYMYQFMDGSIFAFHSPGSWNSDKRVKCSLGTGTLKDAIQKSSFQKYCIEYIDVNGTEPPNKEVRCSDGKSHTLDLDANCVVKKSDITDVYPVAIYDSTVSPASAAASYVLSN